MRKKGLLFISFVLILLAGVVPYQTNAKAAGNDRPRVIISGYEVTNGGIAPGESATVTLTLTNTNSSYSIYGLLINIAANDSVYPSYGSSGQGYIDVLKPGASEQVELKLTAYNSLPVNAVQCLINMDFQNDNAAETSYDTTISIPVIEDALKIDKIDVPQYFVANAKGRISLTCENNTAGDIYHAVMTIKSEDNILTTTEIGNVISGSRINPDAYLSFETTGTYSVAIELSYQDAQGNIIKKNTDEYKIRVTDAEKNTSADSDAEKTSTGSSIAKIIGALAGMLVFGALSIVLVFRKQIIRRR